MSRQSDITLEQLDAALDYLAHIIEAYGDQYWPIFEALEKEFNRKLEQKRKLRHRLKRNYRPLSTGTSVSSGSGGV